MLVFPRFDHQILKWYILDVFRRWRPRIREFRKSYFDFCPRELKHYFILWQGGTAKTKQYKQRVVEQSVEKAVEQAAEQAVEQAAVQAAVRAAVQAAVQAAEQAAEKAAEKAVESNVLASTLEGPTMVVTYPSSSRGSATSFFTVQLAVQLAAKLIPQQFQVSNLKVDSNLFHSPSSKISPFCGWTKTLEQIHASAEELLPGLALQAANRGPYVSSSRQRLRLHRD